MLRESDISALFFPAIDKLKSRNLLLSSIEFESAFATLAVPNQKTDFWAYLLGCYLACCYSLHKQPSQLTAFDIRAFIETQDIEAVRKVMLRNCGDDLPIETIDAISTYLLTVAGRPLTSLETFNKINPEFSEPRIINTVLDFSTPSTTPKPTRSHYQRQSIGEMAVRTAVRATIWESIRLLLRGIFR